MNIDLPAFLAEHRWALRDAMARTLDRLAPCVPVDIYDATDTMCQELVRALGSRAAARAAEPSLFKLPGRSARHLQDPA
ncbi:hypothetical protein [Roseateles flavus]|uniref:Uncharacterized protein n=1 Tax=Roseateles flavus TaxID=3149041 RepID=A0ABV0GF18_9BURK